MKAEVTTSETPAHPARGYGIAIAAVAVATVVRLVLQPVFGTQLQFITYFPAVFLTAVIAGFRPTLVAVALSAFLAEYLFFPPLRGFDFGDPVGVGGLTLFTVTGIGLAWLGEARHLAGRRTMDAR